MAESTPTATNEGLLRNSGSDYATVQGATSASVKSTGKSVGQTYIDPNYYIWRSYLTFAIPSMSAITSGVLHLYGNGNSSTTDFDMYVVSSTYSNPLTESDFDLRGSTPFNDAWNSADFVNAGDNALTFNAAGLAAILAASGGTIKLALISKEDNDVSAPAGNEYVSFNDSATLTITYTAAYNLAVASGAMTVAGTAAGLKATRKLPVSSGSMTVTGTAVGLKATRKLIIDSGALAVTGTAVSLLRKYTLDAVSGALTIAGQEVGIRATRLMSIASGALTIAGTAVGVKAARKLAIASGAMLITGAAVVLTRWRNTIDFVLKSKPAGVMKSKPTAKMKRFPHTP